MNRTREAIVPKRLLIRGNRTPGMKERRVAGHTEDCGTDLCIIYPGHNIDILHSNVISHLTSPAVVKVASTDANDTDGGSGARTVRLKGLDGSLNPQEETLTLSGQTEVTSSSVFSVVEEMKVMSVGASGFNEGTLWVGNSTFSSGVPDSGTALSATEAETNMSAISLIAVPAGEIFIPERLFYNTGDTSKRLIFQLLHYDRSEDISYELIDIHTKQDTNDISMLSNVIGEEGDLFFLRAAVDSGTAQVTGSIIGTQMTL